MWRVILFSGLQLNEAEGKRYKKKETRKGFPKKKKSKGNEKERGGNERKGRANPGIKQKIKNGFPPFLVA